MTDIKTHWKNKDKLAAMSEEKISKENKPVSRAEAQETSAKVLGEVADDDIIERTRIAQISLDTFDDGSKQITIIPNDWSPQDDESNQPWVVLINKEGQVQKLANADVGMSTEEIFSQGYGDKEQPTDLEPHADAYVFEDEESGVAVSLRKDDEGALRILVTDHDEATGEKLALVANTQTDYEGASINMEAEGFRYSRFPAGARVEYTDANNEEVAGTRFFDQDDKHVFGATPPPSPSK